MENTSIYTQEIPIEMILYGQFIKYTSLERMVQKEFVGSDANQVNVYIDLYHFFLPAFRFIKVDDKYSMTSIVLNYCAHLRSFFRTRYSVDSTIFLVYGTGRLNSDSYPDWDCKHYNRMINNQYVYRAMLENLKMISLLCQYINGVFYIENPSIESGILIGSLIRSFRNKAPNIVISNNDFNYQLPVFIRSTVVFRKRTVRVESGYMDVSFSFNCTDACASFIDHTSVHFKDDCARFNPAAISTLMVLSSIPGKSISGLYSKSKATYLTEFVPSELLAVGEPHSICKAINYGLKLLKKPELHYRNAYEWRYKAIDFRYNMSLYQSRYTKPAISLSKLNDPDTLKDINNRFFIKYPIDLQRL